MCVTERERERERERDRQTEIDRERERDRERQRERQRVTHQILDSIVGSGKLVPHRVVTAQQLLNCVLKLSQHQMHAQSVSPT